MTETHELDQVARLQRLDTTGMASRAAQPRHWQQQAQQAAARAMASEAFQAVARKSRPRIGLWLPAELWGVGQLVAVCLGKNGVPVRCLAADGSVAEGDAMGIDLIVSACNPAWGQAWDTQAHASLGALTVLPVWQFCGGADHPVQSFLFLCELIQRLHRGKAGSDLSTELGLDGESVAHALAAAESAGWRLESPTPENAAKQLAVRLLDRLPIFWGRGAFSAVAQDWAVRQQWYAERAALAVDAGHLARVGVMARQPNYWPNTAVFVEIAPQDTGAQDTGANHTAEDAASRAIGLMARRRFAHLQTTLPIEQPSLLSGAVVGLALGEWLGIYAAFLYHIDPAERIPLSLLFEP